MINARKIIRSLDEYWLVLETLANRSQTQSFSFQEVQALLHRFIPQMSSEQAFRETQRLVQQEILIPQAKSSQLELNRAVLEFIQYLTQEHTLGTVGDIESRIAELVRLESRLQQAVSQKDTAELRRFIRMMDERVREVVKHFKKNELAIMHLVEQAKADERNFSLAHRYAAVMDAFDEYIEPVLQMIDIKGSFQQQIEHIEHTLSDFIDFIEETGFLHQEKEPLVQLRTRLLDMNQIGRESLIRSTDFLMPLREELRKNTLLSRNAAHVLSSLRKQGFEPLLGELVPCFSSEPQKFSLGTANLMTGYMAELVGYEDERYELPTEVDHRASGHIRVPDLQDVVRSAKRTQKQTDMSKWLSVQYPELPVDELLFLYQELSRAEDLQLEHADAVTELEVQGYRLQLHPFLQS